MSSPDSLSFRDSWYVTVIPSAYYSKLVAGIFSGTAATSFRPNFGKLVYNTSI